MKNRALLAAFIFLSCCICYGGSLLNFIFCDQNVAEETRMARYECILNNSSLTERNAIERCQNQTAPSFSNAEFLNIICNNVTTRFQFEICVGNGPIRQRESPFSFLNRLRAYRESRNIDITVLLNCLKQNL
ncbi:uncharacterized protein LOC143237093 [Tachypleus tridentatus]|uniref:uncharacterized protein LOC143237093 n=1 Tax=Tachypleus tridentatus TaxID=6853 RepID=UPI003FCFC87E